MREHNRPRFNGIYACAVAVWVRRYTPITNKQLRLILTPSTVAPYTLRHCVGSSERFYPGPIGRRCIFYLETTRPPSRTVSRSCNRPQGNPCNPDCAIYSKQALAGALLLLLGSAGCSSSPHAVSKRSCNDPELSEYSRRDSRRAGS